MFDDLVQEVGRCMDEQAADYAQLSTICQNLCDVLVLGDPHRICAVTRTGEIKLQQMRARLMNIIRRLTEFAEARPTDGSVLELSAQIREEFEAASKRLLKVASDFRRTRETAAMLTTSGATFATACIENCGIKPSTYRKPYARNGEGRPWA